MIFIVANYGGYGGLEGSLGSPQTTRHFLEQRMAISMQAGPCVVSLYMWLGNMVGAAGKTGKGDTSGATTANQLGLNPRIIPKAACWPREAEVWELLLKTPKGKAGPPPCSVLSHLSSAFPFPCLVSTHKVTDCFVGSAADSHARHSLSPRDT